MLQMSKLHIKSTKPTINFIFRLKNRSITPLCESIIRWIWDVGISHCFPPEINSGGTSEDLKCQLSEAKTEILVRAFKKLH